MKILICIDVSEHNVLTTHSVTLTLVLIPYALIHLTARRMHLETVDAKEAIALKILIAILAAVLEAHAAQQGRAKHHPLLTQTNAKE